MKKMIIPAVIAAVAGVAAIVAGIIKKSRIND